MKSAFKATALLSASSIMSILVSFASAKVLAMILRPSGYGYYGLLQSFVGLTVLIAGMGMATGLVRLGASAAKQGDEAALASLRGGAWLLLRGLSILLLLGLALFRVSLSQLVLGSPDHAATIVLMGIAIFFTAATNIQVGILNAFHRVKALAKYGATNTIVGALIAIIAVMVWRMNGIVLAVIGGAVANWVVAHYLVRHQVNRGLASITQRERLKAAWALLRFGGPFTASMLAGTGAQLILPIIILHLLGTESVGYYRAAMGISVSYLGFLITAMGQDYYPRLSAVREQPLELAKLINEQHRLIMLLAVPMILCTLALVPVLVPLVYSPRFTPTVEILEWQLIGDLFKFSSWTMSFVILARCRAGIYFLTEFLGGVAILATTSLAVHWFGLRGLGIGFLATYVIYYGVVWLVVRREVRLVWSANNKKMMLVAVAAALMVRILPATRFASLRTMVALVLAVGIGIFSLAILWREFITAKEAERCAPAVRQTEILPATQISRV